MDAKTLSLPISVLNPNEPCCVEIGTSLSQVIQLMQDGRFGCLLVVDRRARLVGIVTERDLLIHVMAKGISPGGIMVDEIMTPDPEALRATDPIAFALNRMHLGHYRHVPLVVFDDADSDDENGYPVGIISSRDITNHVASFLKGKQED